MRPREAHTPTTIDPITILDGPSIVDRVTRAQRIAVASVALLAVLGGGLASGITVVRRDDATGLAIARVFAAEIASHAGDPLRPLDEVVRHEVREQAAFGRQIEVWRGDTRVGGDGRMALIGAAPREPGRCGTETLGQRRWRVCAAMAATHARVVVASPIEPLLGMLGEVLGSIALATLLAMLAAMALSRRVVTAALSPLRALGGQITALDPLRPSGRLGSNWGAREVDVVAARFDALLDRIDVALQRERRFLFDASHELRTPLTRLRSQLDLVCDDDPQGTELGDSLAAARRNCEALVRTTESVLALARSEAPVGEAVDLGDVVQGWTAALMEHDTAAARRLTLETPTEALVLGDGALLALAIGNLIENALKFSTGPVRVTVESGADVRVTVHDRGDGIPDDEVERVFEPFFRGRFARSGVPGAGLGLALSRHVATAYGGRVFLERPAHGGLSVVFALPPWGTARVVAPTRDAQSDDPEDPAART